VRKDKLTRLERATRAGREQKVLREVFLNTMAQIKALADGEETPAPHPRASDPRFREEVCGSIHRIAGGGTGPVEDLSEPEHSREVPPNGRGGGG
jgi:hypothetical protein